MKRSLIIVFLIAALLAVLLAACGSGSTVTVTRSATAALPTSSPAPTAELQAVQQTAAGCSVPAGEGFMGACAPKPVSVFPNGQRFPLTARLGGCKIPDVSSWQGRVNWPAVIAWQRARGCRPAGIFKMGEYVSDPFAATNAAGLHRLGAFAAGYWFLRATGCSHEASQILAAAHALGLHVVVLDDEAREAAGMLPCLAGPLRRAGLIVVGYTSPGAFPGGPGAGLPTWIAAYGPANPPASPWGGRLVAFQCSDGVFGCVTIIPGVPRGDVSIDLGITRLSGKPPAPRVHCFGPHARLRLASCQRTRARVRTWSRELASAKRALASHQCRRPYRRRVCRVQGHRVSIWTRDIHANLY